MLVRGTDSASATSTSVSRSGIKGASGDSQFAELLNSLMGTYPAASKQTLDALVALEKKMTLPQPTWKDGIYAIHTETIATDRDETLKAFTAAASSLLDDYGIDRSVPINLLQDAAGRIRVFNGNAESEAIEGVLNASPLLQNAMGKVMGLSYQLYMIDQFNSGNLDPKQAGAVLSDMTFELGGSGDPMEGVVRLMGDMLASAVKSQADKREAFAEKKFDEFQQQVEEQHRLDEEARERRMKEKLEQQAADKRYEHIHPDQKVRPVFI